jgi:hypothetical protein
MDRTFQTRNLTVDYITFNLRNGTSQIQEIANIFNADYFFDSYIVDQKYKNPSKEPVVLSNKFHQLVFGINSSEHKASTVLIQFSGENAAYLYNLLKSGNFYWSDFDHFDLVLARFDINYIRQEQEQVIDDSAFQDFGERSMKKYKARYPQALTEPLLTTGFGLGTRKGDYFLRVYRLPNNFLKFELEIKKSRAKSYHIYLLNLNQAFLEFENLIGSRFYQYLKLSLVLDTRFTDWLVINLRKTKKPLNRLVSSYISTNFKLQQTPTLQLEHFYRLLQLLSFTRSYSPREEVLNGEVFQTFTFPLKEFARDIGFNKQNYTHYQRQKLLSFFKQLQKISLTEWFTDDEFKNVLVFPVTKIIYEQPDNKYTKLIVKISIAKDFLSSWNYSFYFPKDFYSYNNQDDLRVKLAILKTIASQPTIRKEFDLSNFLKNLPAISNQRITAIKYNIIKLFECLQKESFIEAHLHLHQKDGLVKANQLQIKQINKIETIVFYETTKFFK